jgi:uncharacterized protein YrrD
MRKGKNVVGLPVMAHLDGRRIESVKDVLISATQESIAALLVDEGGLLSSSRVIPIEAVESFGRDAVVISGADAVVSASADPDVKAILNRNDKLLGKRVMTNTGDALGSVSDMYFEEATGRIVGLELSGGMLGDIARGTSYLPVPEIERMGPDVIFVSAETGTAISGQVGGFMGAVNDARDQLAKTGDAIGERVYKTQDEIQARLAQGPPEETLVGRLAGADVADENGSIVVANGQRVTREHVEWARSTNNTATLTKAVAAGEARAAGARLGAVASDAGDNLGAMWDRFTQRISEARDAQGRQADAQQTQMRLAQISDAIGRPVGKVILDRDDNVILDFGDIITHQAIQQAYDAGMLDTMLASAYRAEFGLPVDQLKAKQPASATVEQATGGATVVAELEQKVQQTQREEEERREQERAKAQAAADERARERTQRSRARSRTEQQEQREIERARATTSAGTAVTR